MSSPENQRYLFRNIDWKTKDEKRAFFNRYFNTTKRELVLEEIDKALESYKSRLIGYIDSEIIENKKRRSPTLKEIKEYMGKL